MKKLISLLAALAVVTTGTVAFAAEGFTVETTVDGTTTSTNMTVAGDEETVATITKDAESDLYEIDLATVAGSQDQTTILAVAGKAVKVGSIKYINQSATPSFAFDMDDPTETVYVLAGGSAISPTLVGKIVPEASTPDTFKVYGFVADTYATVYLGDLSVEVDSTGAYAFEKLAADAYELIIKAPGAFNKTIDVNVTNADVLVASADAPTTLVYGAVRENATKVEIDDLTAVKIAFGSTTSSDTYSLACDFDRDGDVDIDDLTLIKINFNKTIEEVYAEADAE